MFLWIFWAILVGKADWYSLAIGLFVSVFLVWLNNDLLFSPGEARIWSPSLGWKWLGYLAWLVLEIIKANVQVAIVVLSPRLPITPEIVSFRTRLKTDIGRMVLGNSITLTPGTVTIEAEGNEFLVHSLTKEAAEGLKKRMLEKHLIELESGGVSKCPPVSS